MSNLRSFKSEGGCEGLERGRSVGGRSLVCLVFGVMGGGLGGWGVGVLPFFSFFGESICVSCFFSTWETFSGLGRGRLGQVGPLAACPSFSLLNEHSFLHSAIEGLRELVAMSLEVVLTLFEGDLRGERTREFFVGLVSFFFSSPKSRRKVSWKQFI